MKTQIDWYQKCVCECWCIRKVIYHKTQRLWIDGLRKRRMYPKKALYALMEALREWNVTLENGLSKLGFCQSLTALTFYSWTKSGHFVDLLVYVGVTLSFPIITMAVDNLVILFRALLEMKASDRTVSPDIDKWSWRRDIFAKRANDEKGDQVFQDRSVKISSNFASNGIGVSLKRFHQWAFIIAISFSTTCRVLDAFSKHGLTWYMFSPQLPCENHAESHKKSLKRWRI